MLVLPQNASSQIGRDLVIDGGVNTRRFRVKGQSRARSPTNIRLNPLVAESGLNVTSWIIGVTQTRIDVGAERVAVLFMVVGILRADAKGPVQLLVEILVHTNIEIVRIVV